MDWRKKYKDKIVASPEEAVKIIKDGDFVMFQEGHAENKLLLKALMGRAEELHDVKVMGHLHFGPADYIDEKYKGHFQGYSNFLGANTRPGVRNGRVEFLPLFYFQMDDYYRNVNPPDVFFLQVPPPDENGVCSFGLNADYSVACAEGAKKVIIQINRNLPFTYGASISLDKATVIVEADEEIIEIPPTPVQAKEQAMADFIAPLINDGDCLQLGVGGTPDALLQALHDKKDLGIHTELFSDGVVDLYNAGVITNQKKSYRKGKFVTNFVMGTKKIFDFVDHNPDVMIVGVAETNDPYIIAKNDNMVSINSALQVDLLGQVASDTLMGHQYSGVGGQVDFVRGSQMARNGKSILVLRSTAKNDTISNVVCFLQPGTAVTTSRYDVQYVCTEYGIVNIKGLTISERAKALISIAHPDFREELTRQAKEADLIFE